MHQQEELVGAMLLRSSRRNKALYTLPRTGFSTEVCSYCSFPCLDCDPSRKCLTPEVDWLTM